MFVFIFKSNNISNTKSKTQKFFVKILKLMGHFSIYLYTRDLLIQSVIKIINASLIVKKSKFVEKQ